MSLTDNRTGQGKRSGVIARTTHTKVASGGLQVRAGNVGRGKFSPPSMRPKVGSKLTTAAGDGNATNGLPATRKANPAITNKAEIPGDKNQDSGTIRGSQEYKKLMGALKRRAVSSGSSRNYKQSGNKPFNL